MLIITHFRDQFPDRPNPAKKYCTVLAVLLCKMVGRLRTILLPANDQRSNYTVLFCEYDTKKRMQKKKIKKLAKKWSFNYHNESDYIRARIVDPSQFVFG